MKYGTNGFYDLNLMTRNVNLKKYRDFMRFIADQYKLKLKSEVSDNSALVDSYDKLYPDSQFSPIDFKLLKAFQPKIVEIQSKVIDLIKNAKEKIVLVHPYYYPVRIFEKELIAALKRGIRVELITSAKRDIPPYHYLKNYQLLKSLIDNGCAVYETHEKYLHMKAYQIDNKHYSLGIRPPISLAHNLALHNREELLGAVLAF